MKPNSESHPNNCYCMKTFFDGSRGTETCFPSGREKQAPQEATERRAGRMLWCPCTDKGSWRGS